MRKLIFPFLMASMLALVSGMHAHAAGARMTSNAPGTACHTSKLVLPYGTREWTVTTCADWSYDGWQVTNVRPPRVECWSKDNLCAGSTSSIEWHGAHATVVTRTVVRNKFLWWVYGAQVIRHEFTLFANGAWSNETPYPY